MTTPHNKPINYAPLAPDALTARRLLRRYVSMSKFRNCAVLLGALWTAVAMAQKPTIVLDEDGLLKFEGRNCGNSPIPYMIHELNRMQLEAEGKSGLVSIQERNLEQGEASAEEQNRENLSDQDT